MSKTILVTGATDGIGFETAKMLLSAGHTVLLHGRSSSKLRDAQATLAAGAADDKTQCYLADMANFGDETTWLAQVYFAHMLENHLTIVDRLTPPN